MRPFVSSRLARPFFLVSGLLTILFASLNQASFGQTAGLDFFENRIRPVLVERCYSCHNSTDSDDGGLVLDCRDGLIEGGDSGPAIVKGKPEKSLLIQAIRHQADDELRMPKDDGKLSDRIIADFEKWISMGAPDPRDHPPTADQLAQAISWEAILQKRKKFWSLQPLRKIKLPEPIDDSSSGHPVDRFIDRKLAEVSLAANKTADRRTLIRRASFAITGLPPTPEAISRFENDHEPGAYERLVDRLLQSDHFGERWARHWMDWVRYAESHGSEGDPNIPNAWQYRDYLIRALNQDVSYRQLVLEHLAGDQLESPRVNAELGLNESRIGLGHFRFVEHGYGPTDALDEQVRFIDNQIDVVSKAFLGMTVSCARCHDHKFDAISQKDFYRWYGVFNSSRAATINVSSPEVIHQNRKRMATIKNEFTSQLIERWTAERQSILDRIRKLPPPLNAQQRSDKNLQSSMSESQAIINRALTDPLAALYPLARMRDPDRNLSDKEMMEQLVKQIRDSQQSLNRFLESKRDLDWDLGTPESRSQFYLDGPDSTIAVGRAGDLAISHNNLKAVDQILPAGVYSHAISTKHGGLLTTREFDVENDELWVRVAGQGGSRVRYAVQNIPRVAGPVYKANGLNHADFRWIRWDMRYWTGDKVYVEVATSRDIPVEAGGSVRSWFGIREVVTVSKGQPRPKNEMAEVLSPLVDAGLKDAKSTGELLQCYDRAIEKALDDWKHDKLKNAQALFLNSLLQSGMLDNKPSEFSTQLSSHLSKYRELEAEIRTPVRAPGVIEGEVADQPMFVRGNHKVPGKSVRRGFLEALDPKPFENLKTSGRLQLAQRIVDPSNPLMTRVIVNRIWHHCFGVGIVSTPDNFGQLGMAPTHPELLDFLAQRFQKEGHSIKSLIRLLVTSETFKRSSVSTARARQIDPGNRWLSHMRLRRLEAEAIRDQLIFISGQWDSKLYGPPTGRDALRRSVYANIRRNSLHPLLAAFDAPAPFSSQGKRDVTNVPAQSLALMNDPFVAKMSRNWIDRIFASKHLETDEARITALFETALGRKPDKLEIAKAIQFLESSEKAHLTAVEKRKSIQSQLEKVTKSIEGIIEPARQKVLSSRKLTGQNEKDSGPEPFAHWKFDGDLRDSVGKLHGKAIDQAKVRDGKLILDGKSFVMTPAIGRKIHAKTLEVSLTMKNLNQRGGGAITIQTLDGGIFDSIVFAERQPRQWMSGSNSFARTRDLGGPKENRVIHDDPVHLAIVYSKDGTITCYRNGEPYGKPYRSTGPVEFSPGGSQILFGLRHGTPSRRTTHLEAEIHFAKFHDRALTAEEVRASASGDPNYVSRKQFLKAMSEADRDQLVQLEQKRDQLEIESQKWSEPGMPTAREHWYELGKAMVNLKEFIYLK